MIQKIQAKEAKYFEIIMKFRQPVDFYLFSVDQRFSASRLLFLFSWPKIFEQLDISLCLFHASVFFDFVLNVR